MNTTFRGWPRRARQAILFLMICLVVTCCSMVFGSWSYDRKIDANRGEAIATVRHADVLRVAVDFVDEQGEYRSPPNGLLYPVGLEEGQRVRVEYSRNEPDIVRVQGRKWTLSIIPALSIVLVGVLVAVPLWWLTVRATNRLREDSPDSTQKQPEGLSEV